LAETQRELAEDENSDMPEGDVMVESVMIDHAPDKRPKTSEQTAEAL